MPASRTDTPSGPLPEDRLDSWKEVAAYLKRDVTTVQRWEKREAMPVHRHRHNKIGSVYAFRAELDAWARGRSLREDQGAGTVALADVAMPRPAVAKGRARWSAAAGLIVLGVGAVVGGVRFWLVRNEVLWRSPVADAHVESVTDFDGRESAAAISPDGRLAAFLSDRDGQMDVWMTRLGSGQFHNLTAGTAPELVNGSVRTLGFTPDGALVTYWVRRPDGKQGAAIGVWSVPTQGGTSTPYLDSAAEFDWSRDGSRLVYHTTGPGDPMFVTSDPRRPSAAPVFSAPAGLHAHFPLWSADGSCIYFVQGALPDDMDIWRVKATGGAAERITTHHGRVSHPVLLDARTLAYLANDSGGSGPWLYSIDVDRRIPHRLLASADRYTSVSASADGARLLVTVTHQKRTLWRLPLGVPDQRVTPTRIALPNGAAFSPRVGPDYLVYISSAGGHESVWKLVGQSATELWTGAAAKIIAAPAISPDGRLIAVSVRGDGGSFLYVMRTDGTEGRVIASALDLHGAPAWAPDGRSITTAADDRGTPRLMKVPLDGSPPTRLVQEYSTDPAWSADGTEVLYSGPDIGTTFAVKGAALAASAKPFSELTLTRGARHLAFFPDRRTLVVLRGEIDHKNLWLVDLETRQERQLTNFPADFNVSDFDLSPDGGEVVLERTEAQSNVAILDRRHHE
ncbi:MAG: DNA-binding protein [Acidobacteriota bacterium]